MYNKTRKRNYIPVVVRDIKVNHNEVKDSMGNVLMNNNTYSIKANVRADVKSKAPSGSVITRPKDNLDSDYVEISEDAMRKILEVGSLNGKTIPADIVNHPEKAQALYDKGTPLLYDATTTDSVTYDCLSKESNGFKSLINTTDLPDQEASKITFDKKAHEKVVTDKVKSAIKTGVTQLTMAHDKYQKTRDHEYETYFKTSPSEITNAGADKDCVLMVNGMKWTKGTTSDGREINLYGLDLVADVSGISDADRVIKNHDKDINEDGMMHFKHLVNNGDDHYSWFSEKDATKILQSAFDYDEYGRPIESKTFVLEDWDSPTSEIQYDLNAELNDLHDNVVDGMHNLPYQVEVKPFDLTDNGQFKVANQDGITINGVFSPKTYPEYQHETTRFGYTDGTQGIGTSTGLKQPMAGNYILPTFVGAISRSANDAPDNFKLDVSSVKPYSNASIRPKLGRDLSQYDIDPLIKYTYRYSMDDLNVKADNYNRSVDRQKELSTPERQQADDNRHNDEMKTKQTRCIERVNKLAHELDFDIPADMMTSLTKDYAYKKFESKKVMPKASTVHANTMSGKQIGLAVNRMQAMDYVDANGNDQSFVVVDAIKRGDIDNQHNKFDGQHVVNRKRKDGSIIHGQVISNESAKKILDVNGYSDAKREDYGKISSKQTLVFDANVFQSTKDISNNYNFNPKPDLINESKVEFDKAKHNQSVSEHETTNVNRSRDFDLEP